MKWVLITPRHAHPAAGQLDAQRVGEQRLAEAAVLLRDHQAEQPHLAHLVDDGLRIGVGVLEFLRVRNDLLVDELPHVGDDLGLELGQAQRLSEFWSCATLSNTAASPAAADTHGFQPVARLAPIQFASQRGEHPPAGGADRVAERNPRPVHVRALAVGRGEPHSRITASACAANASLSSIRSMSLSCRPALPARLGRRHRPDAHDVRRDPADPHETSRTSGSTRVRRPSPAS